MQSSSNILLDMDKILESIPADIPMPDLSSLPWYSKVGSVNNPLDFVMAIEWQKETSLHAVVGFHLLICILIVRFWRNSTVRVFMWGFFCLAIAIDDYQIHEPDHKLNPKIPKIM